MSKMRGLLARLGVVKNSDYYDATGRKVFAFIAAGNGLEAGVLPPEHVCQIVGPALSALAELLTHKNVTRDDILRTLDLMPSEFGKVGRDMRALNRRKAPVAMLKERLGDKAVEEIRAMGVSLGEEDTKPDRTADRDWKRKKEIMRKLPWAHALLGSRVKPGGWVKAAPKRQSEKPA